MEQINLIIAKNLKRFREQKKLSLERVSQLTGVSKTMIGQIERGESSPTITTIWKIANGLKISFTTLINHPEPDASVILKDEVQALSEDHGKYRVYPYFPYQDKRQFEVYTVEIEPGGYLKAEAHREGTEELLTIFDGEIIIGVNDIEYKAKSGDAIRFKADRPHSYYNPGVAMTRLSMTIFYPS